MGIVGMLRTIGLLSNAPPKAVDDQTYSEAVMENAMRESDITQQRLNEVAARGALTNARLSAGIERLVMSNVDKRDILADLVHGMNSR